MFAKRLAGVVACFKDICKTVAMRHQISHCGKWFSECSATINTKLSVSDVTHCQVCEIDNYETLLDHVRGISQADEIQVTSNITYLGTTYRAGMVVVKDVVNETPVFCRIQSVFLIGNLVLLSGEEWTVDHFDEHLHAYMVHRRNCCTFTRFDELIDPHPLHLNFYGGGYYITLRYEVV